MCAVLVALPIVRSRGFWFWPKLFGISCAIKRCADPACIDDKTGAGVQDTVPWRRTQIQRSVWFTSAFHKTYKHMAKHEIAYTSAKSFCWMIWFARKLAVHFYASSLDLQVIPCSHRERHDVSGNGCAWSASCKSTRGFCAPCRANWQRCGCPGLTPRMGTTQARDQGPGSEPASTVRKTTQIWHPTKHP